MMGRVNPVIHGTFTVPADLTAPSLVTVELGPGDGGTRLQLNALAAALS
jgi:hypothetical protein